ncbi:MAG: hypothetical protein ACPLXP_00355 [Microgenomates group bacterium]
MGIETILSIQETSSESWLSEIEAHWRDIPEFKADPRKLGHFNHF